MGKIPADLGTGLVNVELIYTGHPRISGLQPQRQEISHLERQRLCGKYGGHWRLKRTVPLSRFGLQGEDEIPKLGGGGGVNLAAEVTSSLSAVIFFNHIL